MFNLDSAIVLGLVLVGLVSLARSVIYGDSKARVVALVSLVVAFASVQLVAASDFASDEVVLSRALNSMNFASQLVVSLLAAGVASGIWQGFTTVKNIGQNQS